MLRFDAATGATLTVTVPADHVNSIRQLESYERMLTECDQVGSLSLRHTEQAEIEALNT